MTQDDLRMAKNYSNDQKDDYKDDLMDLKDQLGWILI